MSKLYEKKLTGAKKETVSEKDLFHLAAQIVFAKAPGYNAMEDTKKHFRKVYETLKGLADEEY